MKRKWIYLCDMFRTWWTYARLRVMSMLPMEVTVDGTDNSCTVNRSLYAGLNIVGDEKFNRIYSFKAGQNVGFTLAPVQLAGVETVFHELQWNDKYRTVGFELTSPSVAQMLYAMGMPHDAKARLTVKPRLTKGLIWFEIIMMRRS